MRDELEACEDRERALRSALEKVATLVAQEQQRTTEIRATAEELARLVVKERQRTADVEASAEALVRLVAEQQDQATATKQEEARDRQTLISQWPTQRRKRRWWRHR